MQIDPLGEGGDSFTLPVNISLSRLIFNCFVCVPFNRFYLCLCCRTVLVLHQWLSRFNSISFANFTKHRRRGSFQNIFSLRNRNVLIGKQVKKLNVSSPDMKVHLKFLSRFFFRRTDSHTNVKYILFDVRMPPFVNNIGITFQKRCCTNPFNFVRDYFHFQLSPVGNDNLNRWFAATVH